MEEGEPYTTACKCIDAFYDSVSTDGPSLTIVPRVCLITTEKCSCTQLLASCNGATITIRIRGGGWSFLEINIFVGKMGEINKWPKGLVEMQPILR